MSRWPREDRFCILDCRDGYFTVTQVDATGPTTLLREPAKHAVTPKGEAVWGEEALNWEGRAAGIVCRPLFRAGRPLESERASEYVRRFSVALPTFLVARDREFQPWETALWEDLLRGSDFRYQGLLEDWQALLLCSPGSRSENFSGVLVEAGEEKLRWYLVIDGKLHSQGSEATLSRSWLRNRFCEFARQLHGVEIWEGQFDTLPAGDKEADLWEIRGKHSRSGLPACRHVSWGRFVDGLPGHTECLNRVLKKIRSRTDRDLPIRAVDPLSERLFAPVVSGFSGKIG